MPLNDESRPPEGEFDLFANANTKPTPPIPPFESSAPLDSSAALDSSVPPDTGVPLDASAPPDAGAPLDASAGLNATERTEPPRGSSVRAQGQNGRLTGQNPGFPEGARIGGYVLRECIGQGGMARVYRAEHEGLQRQVALKVLLETPGVAGEGHERFLREARIAAAIKHRNVVNIFDVGLDRGTPYLAMELLEGADLDTFMGGKNRLDEATTMDIIVPIASALATVHDAGIVHRDLKPGNIFLARGRNDELEPRLLDFGISKSTAEQLRLTSTQGPVLGTPFYMSPEAAAGGEMTALSDQYALGVVLYECLTGVHPFAASSNFVDIVHRIRIGDYTPISLQNPQLSRRMVAIVERAMQLDPARRFADMRALGRELLLLAGQRTRITWQLSFTDFPGRPGLVKSSVLSVTPPLPMVRRRRRRWPYALPALLAVLLLGTWQSGRLEPLRGHLAPLRARAEAWVAAARERVGSLGSERVTVERARDLPVRTLALEPVSASPPAPNASFSGADGNFPTSIATGAGEIAPAAPETELGLGASTTADHAEAPALSSNTTALAVNQALRGTPPRARNARRSKSNKGTRAAAPSTPLELGTNNAPILD
jgi:serine/threonine protein kinase